LHNTRPRRRALLPAALCALVIGGCGGDDPAPAERSDVSEDGGPIEPEDSGAADVGGADAGHDSGPDEDAGPCADDACECQADADCADRSGGDLCKEKWICDTGTHKCVKLGGTAVVCPDDTVCAKDRCDPGTGKCGLVPRPDGTACDDEVACTVGDGRPRPCRRA